MAGAVMKAILNDTAYPVTLINGIKGTEKTSRLTQVQLAKQTGIAQTTLSGYENGRYDIHSMTLDNALRLSWHSNATPTNSRTGGLIKSNAAED